MSNPPRKTEPSGSAARGSSGKVLAKLLAVIPALNEEAAIGPVVRATLRQGASVLVVDDGSRDRTAELAREAGARVVSHPRNLGKGAALRTGFAAARREGWSFVATIDGDGQHDPDDLPVLARALEENGAQLAAGDRMDTATPMPFERKLTNRFSGWAASRLTGCLLPDPHCGLRLLETAVLDGFTLRSSRYAADVELVLWACFRGFRVVSVPIRCIYGNEKSGIDPLPDGLRLLALGGRAVKEVLRHRFLAAGEARTAG